MNMRTLAFVAATWISPALFAVTTDYFQDTQSTDFKAGKTDNVVISNTGRITLGAEVRKLLEKRPDVTTVFDVRALANDEILAAGGPEGKLLLYRDKKWDVLYTADQPYIFSLESGPNGLMYLGTGGTTGRVIEFNLTSKEAKVLFENKDIQYIWSLKRLSDGRLLAATGPTGKLFLIDKSGGKEIFSCKQKNLQAMTLGADGAIYVGTDTEGIIYKIQPRDGKYVARALYDAKEDEISALAVDPAGNLYAATASGNAGSDQARSYLTKPAGTPAATTAPTTTSAASKTSKPAKNGKPLTTAAAKPDQRPGPQSPMKFPEMTGGPGGPMSMPAPAGGKGNAVYRIDPTGFVTEVFRDQVNINSMIYDKGKLYLGTGPDGYVFAVNPATEEVTLVAKTGAGYVNALGRTPNKALVLATGNPGQVIELGPQLAKSGTFTSKVFDAEQISRWGMIDITVADPATASHVTVQTRSSVLADPDDPGWSEWSAPVPATKPVRIVSPAARFIQYKLTFKPDGGLAAAVQKVMLAYMEDNRRPEVASIIVNTGQAEKTAEGSEGEGPAEPPPMPMGPQMPKPKIYRFMWKASDPNNDPLRYFIYLRRLDTPYWIQLEKDFTPTMMQWDPRSAPDGKYELKVVASDNLSNPIGLGLSGARISDPFTVDNTPPVIRNLTCKLTAPGQLLIRADLADDLSEISNAAIALNAGKNWQYIPPVDTLYDSKNERIDATIPVEPPNGPIMVTIKVTDRAGNSGYAWTLVPQAAPHPSQATDGVDTDEKH